MNVHLTTIGLFIITALAEIFGCYTFYLWLTLKKSPVWLAPGGVGLLLFLWGVSPSSPQG